MVIESSLMTLSKELVNAKVSTDSVVMRGLSEATLVVGAMVMDQWVWFDLLRNCSSQIWRNCFHDKCSRTAWIFCSLRSFRRACSRVCWALHAGKDHQWPYSIYFHLIYSLGSMDCKDLRWARGSCISLSNLVRSGEIRSSTLDEHGTTEGKQVAKHNPTTLTNDGVQNAIPWFPSYWWHLLACRIMILLTNVTHHTGLVRAVTMACCLPALSIPRGAPGVGMQHWHEQKGTQNNLCMSARSVLWSCILVSSIIALTDCPTLTLSLSLSLAVVVTPAWKARTPSLRIFSLRLMVSSFSSSACFPQRDVSFISGESCKNICTSRTYWHSEIV